MNLMSRRESESDEEEFMDAVSADRNSNVHHSAEK